MQHLSSAALASLDARVEAPAYDRAAVTAGIVHFGVGGFHRAHQAMYLDRLMNEGKALDWGICGVGVMPHDARMRDALAAQDCLYTLVVKHPDGTLEPRVIGSIVRLPLRPRRPGGGPRDDGRPGDADRVADDHRGRLQRPPRHRRVRRPTDAGLQADLAPGAVPGTVFGLVTEALRRRRDRGLRAVHRDVVRQHPGQRARRRSGCSPRSPGCRTPTLADWVEREVPFPNSMVDRITPGHHGRRPEPSSRERVRPRGRLAGGVRAVHPVGAGGRLQRRPARRSRTSASSWSPTSSRTS